MHLPTITALCGLNGKEGTVTTNTKEGIEYIISRSNGEISLAFCKRCLKKAGILKNI